MELYQLCAVAVLTAITALLLRGMGKDQHIPILIGCLCLLIGSVAIKIGKTQQLWEWIKAVGFQIEMQRLWKGLGICIAVEMAAGLCRQCGAEQIGSVLEWAGKVEILLLALPLVQELFEMAQRMLS